MDINNHTDEMRKMNARLKRIEYALGLVDDCEEPGRSDNSASEWPDMTKMPFLHPDLVAQIVDRIEPMVDTRIGSHLQQQQQQQQQPMSMPEVVLTPTGEVLGVIGTGSDMVTGMTAGAKS